VKNATELRGALEHFHVLLSETELVDLFAAFQNANGTFNFAAFAERIYPRESQVGAIKDGRTVDQTSPGQAQQYQLQQSPTQQVETLSPQQTQQYANGGEQWNSPGGRPIVMDPAPAAAVLGGTYNNNGTTQYWREADPNSPQQQQQGGGADQGQAQGQNGLSKGNASASKFKPRLTYNRAHHQRYSTKTFESQPQPRPSAYPHQELASKARFDQKQATTLVDVPRRHNISRQYNRDGSVPSAPKRR